MKYSIGEFAAILGLTVDTLRLYEKHDIIRPFKDDKNNYRYFNDLDARSLLMSRWYRSLLIPLQEAATLTKEASLNEVIEKISITEKNLEEEIRRNTLLLSKIKEINRDIVGIEASLNSCQLKKLPGIYRLKQTNGNTLLQDDFLKDMVSRWMGLLPYTFYSFRIDPREILSHDSSCEYSWGLAIFEDEICHFNLELNDNVEYIPPKDYISAVILLTSEEDMLLSSMEFMLNYINEKQYTITGDIIGRIILTEKINGQTKSYLEVNIPI